MYFDWLTSFGASFLCVQFSKTKKPHLPLWKSFPMTRMGSRQQPHSQITFTGTVWVWEWDAAACRLLSNTALSLHTHTHTLAHTYTQTLFVHCRLPSRHVTLMRPGSCMTSWQSLDPLLWVSECVCTYVQTYVCVSIVCVLSRLHMYIC